MNDKLNSSTADTVDIDLLRLIERMILFFRKYKWYFIIALLAGAGTGFYLYRSQTKIYTSRLIVHSFLLTNQEEIQIIDNWNQLVSRQEYGAIAALWNCPEKLVHPLKKIKGDEIQKVFSPNNPNGFVIEVNVTDVTVLDSLQAAIVNGLTNNAYVLQRIAFKRSALKKQIADIETEIRQLDSSKNLIKGFLQNKETIYSAGDLAVVSQELTLKNEKLATYNEDLYFTNAVQVLQGFSKFKEPTGPRLLVWLFLSTVFFLTIAYLTAGIHSINHSLKMRTVKR